jgi:hypothetical protein
MRNAWGRVAVAYDELWTERTAPLTARGLDLLAPAPDWDGCDIGCGPGRPQARWRSDCPRDALWDSTSPRR